MFLPSSPLKPEPIHHPYYYRHSHIEKNGKPNLTQPHTHFFTLSHQRIPTVPDVTRRVIPLHRWILSLVQGSNTSTTRLYRVSKKPKPWAAGPNTPKNQPRDHSFLCYSHGIGVGLSRSSDMINLLRGSQQV